MLKNKLQYYHYFIFINNYQNLIKLFKFKMLKKNCQPIDKIFKYYNYKN